MELSLPLTHLLRDWVQDGLDRLGVEHRHHGAPWSTQLKTKPGAESTSWTPGSWTAFQGTIHQFRVHILHTSTRRRHRAVRGTISSTFAMLSPPPSISAVCVGPGERGATTEIHASPLAPSPFSSVCAGNNNPLPRVQSRRAFSVGTLPLLASPSRSLLFRSGSLCRPTRPQHRSFPCRPCSFHLSALQVIRPTDE